MTALQRPIWLGEQEAFSWGVTAWASLAAAVVVGSLSVKRGDCGMTTIGEAIAPDLREFGGVLRCETCSHIKALGDIGAKLNNGWPKCCGYTMRWWTQRQIDRGEMSRRG